MDDEIIPSSFTIEDPLGNLNECIITSGKLLLDLNYNMKRKVFSVTEVKGMLEDVEVALYSLQRLYAYKLWFRNSSKLNIKVLKPHMTFHFVFEILKTGCLINTDALIYEHKHTDVKHLYRMSSKRKQELVRELWMRMETNNRIDLAVKRYNQRFGPFRFPEREMTKNEQLSYLTKGGIHFSWSQYNSKRTQLLYDDVSRQLMAIDNKHTYKFVNPLVQLNILWYEIQQIRGLAEFLRHFKNGSKGIKFRLA